MKKFARTAVQLVLLLLGLLAQNTKLQLAMWEKYSVFVSVRFQVGDSRAMIIKPDGNVIWSTEDHKPDDLIEVERITRAGGRNWCGCLIKLRRRTRIGQPSEWQAGSEQGNRGLGLQG